MPSNEKFHVTLSQEDGLEIKQRAEERGVAAVQIIREIVTTHLHQEQSQPTPSAPQSNDLDLLTQQIQQISQQVGEIEQSIKNLSDRPPINSSDPQVRTMLQPVLNRLQQLEQQIGVIGNLTQQNLEQTVKGFKRIEMWLEALQTIIEPLLLDYQTEENRKERKNWFNAVLAHLDKNLEAEE